jgi:hypothetical protein
MADPSSASELFAAIERPVPIALSDWEERLDALCCAYVEQYPEAQMFDITQSNVIFAWDIAAERVVLVYGLSATPANSRDASRMRGFPDPNPSLQTVDATGTEADRGHFVAHTAGGAMDMNLFPQRRDLNRGWSSQGKQYRAMERYLADHPSTFFYNRPIYSDETWVPAELELAILRPEEGWWIGRFSNRGVEVPSDRTELTAE